MNVDTRGLVRIDDEGRHQHRITPVEAANGRELDVSRPDLGHPDDPGLWERLYQHCSVGTLVCRGCPTSSPQRHLYLRVDGGVRSVRTYGAQRVKEALGESEEHHALKDRISSLAEERGLHAEQEVGAPCDGRVTDVLVAGGAHDVAWEVQLAPIAPPVLRRRIGRAVADGLAPAWLTMPGRPVWRTLIDRAPATTVRDMDAPVIRTVDDPKILQGIKRIVIEPCRHRAEPWHLPLRCTGRHGRPFMLDPEAEHPSLGQLIEKSAEGYYVPFQWPRSVGGYKRPWLMVPAEDVRRFLDAEPDYARSDTTVEPGPRDHDPVGVPGQTGWHTDPLAALPTRQPAVTREQVERLLGNICPECRWTRGRHQPRSRYLAGCVRLT